MYAVIKFMQDIYAEYRKTRLRETVCMIRGQQLCQKNIWRKTRFRSRTGCLEAQALGLNKTTAFRILRSLIYMGYVTQNEENGKYSLTLKLASLGHKVVLRTDIIVVVHPFLARLSEETGETVHFVKRDGADAVYIDKVMGKAHSAEMGSRIGGRIPLYCSGVGKAICAALSLDETAVVWQESDVRRITPYTITNYEDFMFSLEDVRKRGYALDNEENESGVRLRSVSQLLWSAWTMTGSIPLPNLFFARRERSREQSDETVSR